MRKIVFVLIVCWLVLPIKAQDYVVEAQAAYEEALRRIEAARENEALTLSLVNLYLVRLPPEIGQLTNLRNLTLVNVRLYELPPEIGQLTKLQTLYISHIALKHLPPEIGQLTNLQSLTVINSPLVSLPPEIGLLTKLKILRLSIYRLPPEIGNLAQLQTLDLSYAGVTRLPFELGQLTNLHTLSLPDKLTFPPPEIAAQGTPAIIDYLRTYNRSQQQTIMGIVASFGVFVLLILGVRWWHIIARQRGVAKHKRKNDEV